MLDGNSRWFLLQIHFNQRADLTAVDAGTGNQHWRISQESIRRRPMTLAADGHRIYLESPGRISTYNARNGRLLGPIRSSSRAPRSRLLMLRNAAATTGLLQMIYGVETPRGPPPIGSGLGAAGRSERR
jgi:hypothetical protein